MAAAAATQVTHVLPEDIVVNILARLPVKSLKRFRCVCKSWCLLIQCPKFVSTHYSYRKNRACPLINYVNYLEKTATISLLSNRNHALDVAANHDITSFSSEPLNLTMTDCCNGIVCLREYNLDGILLWNIATKEFKILPACPNIDYPPGYNHYVAAIGFGYDSERDDHKVIRIETFYEADERVLTKDMEDEEFRYSDEYVNPRISETVEQRVIWYELNNDCWRSIHHGGKLAGFVSDFRFRTKGFYHCWASEELLVNGSYILSLDMSSEVFITTPFPDGEFGDIGKDDTVLTEINGSVGGMFCQRDASYLPRNGYYDVWVLGELGVKSSWIKLFTIGPLDIGPCGGVPVPIGVHKDEYFFEKLTDPGVECLIWHHPSGQTTKSLRILANHFELQFYAESLVSPFIASLL